ncbi:MAG: substrate-binding domain-containing protein [Eubacteriales bacterium]|nr:substrate-binding domain-containing protein [Eubacteriales bacterium]
MKRYLSIILVLTLALTLLAGCATGATTAAPAETTAAAAAATTAAADEKVTIGVSVGTLAQERWQREIDMFKEYAAANNIDLIVQSAEDDPQKQISQCENMITQGVDALIVQALDSAAAGAICEPAKAADIPVVSYDRLVMNGDLDYYITFDTVKVGKTEAQFVVDKAPKGNYIWMLGDPNDFNTTLLEQGQTEVLQPLIDSGDIKIILKQNAKNWDPNEALKIAENGLTLANNDLQGYVASNDGTAGGAIQALTAQGLAGKVAIAGQDADVAACQRVVEGTQTGTVYKPLKKLNQAAIQLAAALAKGLRGDEAKKAVDSSLGIWSVQNNGFKDVDSFQVDVVAVSKDNMVQEIIKDGFHTMEEVYKNIPKDQWPAVN